MLINIGICDDDKIILNKLKDFILNFNTDYNINLITANNGKDFLNNIKRVNLDIIFLDIEMKGLNGIEIGTIIKSFNQNIILIYITGHTGYALDAFRVEALDYILKPIDENKFNPLFKKALNRLEEIKLIKINRKQLYFKYNREIISLNYNDIYFFEKVLNKIQIHTKENTYKSYLSIRELESKLDNNIFARCHEGYIVNIEKIKSIKENNLILKDINTSIPISRSRKKTLISFFVNKKHL